jgi:hypothetical protein
MIADADAKLLRLVLDWAQDHEDELDENQEKWRGAFQNMWDKWEPLTERQRSYLKGVGDRLKISDPVYTNDWSAGRIPRGKSLATPVPEVLLRPLPKAPPGRKVKP